MSVFKCNTCFKEFNCNWKLQRHLTGKRKCKEPSEQTMNLKDKVITLEKEVEKINIKLEKTEDLKDDCKYECQYCKKNFNFLSNLIQHKKVCKSKIDNISIYEKQLGIESIDDSNKLQCKYCNTKYTRQSSYSRHMNKGCRDKDTYELELKERVLEQRKTAASNIINNNCDVKIININMPPMNPFGSENLDYITTKLLIKELQKCKAIEQADVCSIVDRFTKLIHANPAHPENQNVLFKSLNSGFASVYTENGFQDQQATEVQDGIIQNVHKLIQTKGCDEYDYNEGVQDTFADVLEDIDVNYGKMDENMKEGTNTRALGKCRNTVKAVLHSNKEEIGSTQNLIN